MQATLTVPSLVVLESFLSFLGLGVQEPGASLGNLLHDGARDMERAPWLLLAPSGVLLVVLEPVAARVALALHRSAVDGARERRTELRRAIRNSFKLCLHLLAFLLFLEHASLANLGIV